MQLVGATKSFIRRPFIWTHMRLGILSSFIALSGLVLVFLEINKRLPELDMLEQPVALTVVFGGVLFLGIGITGVSTFFATQRYLNLKSDAIY
jgi:cell division transport system permease protein